MTIRMRVRLEGQAVFEREAGGPIVTLGRNPAAIVAFQGAGSDMVSWDHARIELRDGAAFLEDRGATNGTYLNNRRITRRTILKVRDLIRLGQQGPELRILDIVPEAEAALSAPAELTADQEPPAVDGHPEAETPARAQLTLALSAAGAAALAILALWLVVPGLLGRPAAEVAGQAAKIDVGPVGGPEAPVEPPQDSATADEPVEIPATAAHPEAKPEPPQLRFTPQELAEQSQGKVVWIGLRAGEMTVAVGTGWAVRTDLVVTTANTADSLRGYQADGARLIVCVDAAGADAVDVGELKTHPQFELSDTVSQMSVAHNLGVLRLQQPLPAAYVVAPTAHVLAGATVTAVGFSVPMKDGELAVLDSQDRPLAQVVTARAFGDGTSKPYSLTPDQPLPMGMNGAPVIAADGTVIGVLAEYGQKTLAVTVQHLDPLMK